MKRIWFHAPCVGSVKIQVKNNHLHKMWLLSNIYYLQYGLYTQVQLIGVFLCLKSIEKKKKQQHKCNKNLQTFFLSTVCSAPVSGSILHCALLPATFPPFFQSQRGSGTDPTVCMVIVQSLTSKGRRRNTSQQLCLRCEVSKAGKIVNILNFN